MSDCFAEFKRIESKLAEVLAENNLVYDFRTHAYPIALVISQSQEVEDQMALFSTNDGVSSRDSVLKFVFPLGGIEVQTDSRVVISDTYFNKIKNLAKKMHYAYLQAFFADRMSTTDLLIDRADDPEPSSEAFREFFNDDEDPTDED